MSGQTIQTLADMCICLCTSEYIRVTVMVGWDVNRSDSEGFNAPRRIWVCLRTWATAQTKCSCNTVWIGLILAPFSTLRLLMTAYLKLLTSGFKRPKACTCVWKVKGLTQQMLTVDRIMWHALRPKGTFEMRWLIACNKNKTPSDKSPINWLFGP